MTYAEDGPVGTVRRLVERRLVPSLAIALSTIDGPSRMAARARLARGGRGRVELFVAFDDAASAVATVDLAARFAGRPVELIVRPVVQRGFEGDPAVDDKRRYALADASRRVQLLGLSTRRRTVVDADETAFLAEWIASVPPSQASTAFAVAAMRTLWCETDGPVWEQDYAETWLASHGTPPVRSTAGVRENERRMARRGPYDTPAAVIGRRWYFAHDRAAQIDARMAELGWS